MAWFSARRVGAIVAALALLAGLAGLGWTWRHPHAFEEAGGWGMGGEHKQVGEKLYVGMSYPVRGHDGKTVELIEGHANIGRGEDVADADLVVCTLDPREEVGAIGSFVGKDVDRFCSDVAPIDHTRIDLTYAPMKQQVLLVLSLTSPGTVQVRDVELSYQDGWRRGSQHIGGEIWMTTGKLPKDYYS